MPDPSSPRPLALRGLTLAVVIACGLIALPVLPGITWGIALALVAWRSHDALLSWVGSRNLAASVSTTAVMLAVLVPTTLVLIELTKEAQSLREGAEEQIETGEWKEYLRKVPYAGDWLVKQAEETSPEAAARQGLQQLGNLALPLAGGLGVAVVQILVTCLVLFFAFRDGPQLAEQVVRLLPMDEPTGWHLLQRAKDAVIATLAGNVLVALLQGVTGGLMFWWLGLPAAVLWGVVMFVASILPVVGAFIVWVPAAAYLASTGEVGKAALLTTWGIVLAGPLGSYIYARIAGGRMKIHPLVSLLAFLGGLAVFGLSGMILGPVLVVLGTELSTFWAGRQVAEVNSAPE